MGKSILNDFQKKVLAIFCKTVLAQKFYLAGGTALSEFYLRHRKSEDLDFRKMSGIGETFFKEHLKSLG